MIASEPEPDALTVKMRLRPRPKPVLRLSRKVLIAGAAVAASGLAAALAVAMMPASKPLPAEASPSPASPSSASAPEALRALPDSYGDIPKLGPPLPGDLGRPLLAAATRGSEERMEGMDVPTANAAPSSAAEVAPAASGVASSGQIFFARTATSANSATAHTTVRRPSDAFYALAEMASDTAPGADAHPLQLSEAMPEVKDAPSSDAFVSARRLRAPVSPYVVETGSVINAALVTGIKSDLPGQVLAQVTQDVFDSLNGQYLLIPRGSRLIGQYGNNVGAGQSRLQVAWTRLTLPNGQSLALDRLPAADPQGFAGLKDGTDFHWAGLFGASGVSTLLSLGAAAGQDDGDQDVIKAIRAGASDSFGRVGEAIVARQLTLPPRLTARPGLPVRVIVSRDLILAPYGERQ